MLRRPVLILLGACFLTASAAWADEVGYVECSNHPEDTKVLSRAAMTEGVVASLPCGERFTILQSGFFFSRVQTKYGKVGYVLSSLISRDYAASSVPQPTPAKMTARTPSDSVTSAVLVPHNAAIPTPAHPRPATAATASAPQVPETVTTFEPHPNALTPPQPTPAPPPTPASAPRVNLPEATVAVVQPHSAIAAQPEPEPAQPIASALRPASGRGLEKPIPHVRRAPLIDLFGGYGFAQLNSGGGKASNLNGALGSFSWNVQPWLQIIADSSYNFVTANGVKTVLYGNHYGPRFFLRGRRRGASPFVEALFGGSRADTTVSGVGGYTASDQSFSVKAGGGLDFQPSRHLEIRLFDVDYYRTSFGANAHQNNYWASAGIVVRLLGGASE